LPEGEEGRSGAGPWWPGGASLSWFNSELQSFHLAVKLPVALL
jgi:hypothetical protein